MALTRDSIISDMLSMSEVLQAEYADATSALGTFADMGLLEYSRYVPQVAVEEVAVNDDKQSAPLPSGFVDRFSHVQQVLDENGLQLEVDDVVDGQIVLAKPTASSTLKVAYTRPLDWADTTDRDRLPIVYAAMKHAALGLAMTYGTTHKSTLNDVDTVNYRHKADVFRDMAKLFQAMFLNMVGANPKTGTRGYSTTRVPRTGDKL